MSEVDTGLCEKIGVPEDLRHPLAARDLCVFVDPVDGTREFVEGRLEAVECLVGVAYRGRAVAGVMGLPFYNDSLAVPAVASQACGRVLYGIAGTDWRPFTEKSVNSGIIFEHIFCTHGPIFSSEVQDCL